MGNQVILLNSDLVFIGEDHELFTDSLVIAEETGYQHHTITRKIRDNIERFKKLGNLDVTSKFTGANPIKIYQLNEPQASFLITLLENNEKVTDFKLRLVQEFYRIKEELLHRREQQQEVEEQLEKKGQLTLEEYNNIRFSEKRTIKTFENCDIGDVAKLINDFLEHIITLDTETRIVRCESAMKGLKRLHDRLAAENVMNIGNCYNLLAYIDQIKEKQHITENKRNGGLKAAQTKEINRLQKEIEKVKPFEFEREGRVAGVYCIRNLENGCVYIGASKDVSRRLSQHRNALRENVHYNDDLQFDWNDYGEECFQFTVLDFCDDDEIFERETEWIKSFDYLYNVKKNK